MRRLLVPFITAVLLLAACGGDDKKDVSASSDKTTTTVADDSSTTAVDAGGATTTAAAGKSTATTKAGGTSGSSGGPAPGPQPSTPEGVKATAPGTYTYKLTGTMTVGSPTPQKVDTTTNTKVEPLQGTDQKSTTTTQQGGSEQILRYQGDGAYLVNLKLTGAITKEFVVNPPGLVFPQPVTIGRTWAWSAKSTDGKTTVKSDFKIVRTETITIGGEAVPAVVLEATVVTDGDIKSTSKRVMWVSEGYRLTVRQDEKINGTYGGFAFSGDTSSVLQSTKPS